MKLFSPIKIMVIISTLFISSLTYAEISVVDDIRKTITLKAPAKKIVSLSPSLTELIYASGGGDYLKGVVSYSGNNYKCK